MAMGSTVQPVLWAEVGLCAFAGAAVGLVASIRLETGRRMRTLEGAIMAAVFGGLFMLGSGWPAKDGADPVPVAAAVVSVLLYFMFVAAMARAMAWRAKAVGGRSG